MCIGSAGYREALVLVLPNPFVSSAVTELHFDTGEVWHVHGDGDRRRSRRPLPEWLVIFRNHGYVVDMDFAMDVGL